MSVTVVGSLNEDVLVAVDRLPGRGETVDRPLGRPAPGGKGANQAAAAGVLGPGVHMVGRVGRGPGRRPAARPRWPARGSNVGRVHRTAGVPTGTATIPVEDGTGENLIVVVPGANARADPGGRRRRVGAPGRGAAAAARGAAGRRSRRPRAAAGGTVVLTPAPPQPLPDELLDAGRRPGAQRARAARSWPVPRRASGPPAELVALARGSVAPARWW